MESSEYNGAGNQAREIDDDEKGTEKEAFSNILYAFKKAREAKTTIDKKIIVWLDAYEGKPYGNERKTSSSIVMRDVAKQVEHQKPNLTQPFVSPSKPISATPNDIKSVKSSRITAQYLNNKFTSGFNRYKFMNDAADVFAKEGTVWVRSSWNMEEEREIRKLDKVSMDVIMSIPTKPSNIEQNKDGTFNVEYSRMVLKKNRPFAEVCRNEAIFPDPVATCKEDMQFICYRYDKTMSELRASGLYDEEQLDIVQGRLTYPDTDLGATRLQNEEYQGKDMYYQAKSKPSQRVTIVEYWGFYDLNDDGIAEPVLCTWVDRMDKLLKIEPNPLPDNIIPFHSAPYSAVAFSIWGNAMAELLVDNQKIRTGFMRAILDNSSLANNGQRFIQHGTLDYVNYKRLRNGERYIQTNVPANEGIQDGNFNPLPASVFNVMQMVSKETEDLSGVSSGQPALNNSALNPSSGSGQEQTTMSQQRMADAVRNLASMMEGVFGDWIAYAKEFTSDEEVAVAFDGIQSAEPVDFTCDFNINLSVATEINTQIRINQMNMLMQQSQAIGEKAPPTLMNSLTAEMFDLMDKPDLAEQLRTYQPQPDPFQQQMQQLEMQKLQAEIAKLQAEAQGEGMYKQAQSTEKYAKAEAHSQATALEPTKMAIGARESQEKLDNDMAKTILTEAGKAKQQDAKQVQPKPSNQ